MKAKHIIQKSIFFFALIVLSSCQSQTTKFEGVWYEVENLKNSIEIINNTNTYTIVALKRGIERGREKFNSKLNNETLELYHIEDKNNLLKITLDNKGRLLINGEEIYITKEEYLELEKKQLVETKKKAKEVEKNVKYRFLDVINSYQYRNENAEYFINKMKSINEISQSDYDKFQEVMQMKTEFEVTEKSINNFMEKQNSITTLIKNTLSEYNENASIPKSQDDLIKLGKAESGTSRVNVSVDRYNESFASYSEYIDLPKIIRK